MDQQQALANYRSGPFGGPFSIQSWLARDLAAGDLPYEGIWVPAGWARAATVELTGTGTLSSIQADVWGTNQLDPLNTYTCTVGGSETDGDTVGIVFNNPLLPGGTKTKSIVTSGSMSLAAIAAALAAAINADTDLAGIGLRASAPAAVITLQWPSLAQSLGNSNSQGSPPVANILSLGKNLPGSPSETLTFGLGSDGTNLTPSHLAAVGLTALTPAPVGYVKARWTTLTGAGALCSLAYQGVA